MTSSPANSSAGAARPTVGQMERELSQKIRAFYREHLGHQPSKVSCQLFGDKLACILEDAVTKPEEVLASEGKGDLAEKVREDLDQVMKPQLIELVESIINVKVIDVLSDSALETGRNGTIFILDAEPKTRPSKKG